MIICSIGKIRIKQAICYYVVVYFCEYWSNESSDRQWFWRPEFYPRSSHIKDSKNGI